jgi:predicted acyl esterase
VQAWLQHPDRDPWKLDEACNQISVPNLDIVGWFDHANGDMRLYRTMIREGQTETARRGQRIVIGPLAPLAAGRTPLRRGRFRVRSGAGSGRHRHPLVRLLAQGKGERGRQRCPGADFRDGGQPLAGRAGVAPRARPATRAVFNRQRRGQHALRPGSARPAGRRRMPAKTAIATTPRDPVPTLFGPGLFTATADQRPLATRQDILVYQSEPLAEAIEATGNPRVELFVSSTAPDTDFFVRLIDVAPDGLARDVSSGMVRTRYRNSLERPEMIAPRPGRPAGPAHDTDVEPVQSRPSRAARRH